jgi:hypothetical protein
MNLGVDSRRTRVRSELTRLIDAYVADAAAGRTSGPDGGPYTAAGVRRLQSALELVEAATPTLDLGAVDAMDSAALRQLAQQIVDHAGVRSSRAGAVVDALRGLSSYATWGRPDAPPAWTARPPRRPAAAAAAPAPAPAPRRSRSRCCPSAPATASSGGSANRPPRRRRRRWCA